MSLQSRQAESDASGVGKHATHQPAEILATEPATSVAPQHIGQSKYICWSISRLIRTSNHIELLSFLEMAWWRHEVAKANYLRKILKGKVIKVKEKEKRESKEFLGKLLWRNSAQRRPRIAPSIAFGAVRIHQCTREKWDRLPQWFVPVRVAQMGRGLGKVKEVGIWWGYDGYGHDMSWWLFFAGNLSQDSHHYFGTTDIFRCTFQHLSFGMSVREQSVRFCEALVSWDVESLCLSGPVWFTVAVSRIRHGC